MGHGEDKMGDRGTIIGKKQAKRPKITICKCGNETYQKSGICVICQVWGFQRKEV